MSLIIIVAKAVTAAGFGIWVIVMRQFFFYSPFSFCWPIGLHGSQIIIGSSILNYSVICAGHGACNQQFVHAALICRIAELVCVILLSIVIEICNFSNWRNIIIQIIYNNILSTSYWRKSFIYSDNIVTWQIMLIKYWLRFKCKSTFLSIFLELWPFYVICQRLPRKYELNIYVNIYVNINKQF